MAAAAPTNSFSHSFSPNGDPVIKSKSPFISAAASAQLKQNGAAQSAATSATAAAAQKPIAHSAAANAAGGAAASTGAVNGASTLPTAAMLAKVREEIGNAYFKTLFPENFSDANFPYRSVLNQILQLVPVQEICGKMKQGWIILFAPLGNNYIIDEKKKVMVFSNALSEKGFRDHFIDCLVTIPYSNLAPTFFGDIDAVMEKMQTVQQIMELGQKEFGWLS